MEFLIDEQLPQKLARDLREAGYLANHVAELGLSGASDRALWAQALSRQAVLVTKDADFMSEARLAKPAPKLLWIRLGNVANQPLWQKLKPLMEQVVDAFESGETIVEIS
ncbi:MAG: DUF5615 family PIN-like protein [Hyphomicrobiales bacterium]|nr:DUF5615 family PIN-like protein [Hyphomicrobiales bacterium]OQW84157.1 MAG: hypothetical protein BVN31_04280 [Proteobacteria bacterium ST_bin15]